MHMSLKLRTMPSGNKTFTWEVNDLGSREVISFGGRVSARGYKVTPVHSGLYSPLKPVLVSSVHPVSTSSTRFYRC